jgi:hypothetical protein
VADSLRSKTIHALSWSFLESVGVQGVRFIIGIMLARLLFQEEFGLLGMLTIFIAVAQSVLNSGFGAVLIRKREATLVDTCSLLLQHRSRAGDGSVVPETETIVKRVLSIPTGTTVDRD